MKNSEPNFLIIAIIFLIICSSYLFIKNVEKVEVTVKNTSEQVQEASVKEEIIQEQEIIKDEKQRKSPNLISKEDPLYIAVDWEKEPILVQEGSTNIYKIGEVLDGEYKGADVLFMYNTDSVPYAYSRVIRKDNQDIILDNYSSHKNHNASKNIFISNLYPFEELQLNCSTSLVLDKDFHDYNTILFKDQKKYLEAINFEEYTLYKRDGKFFALNYDGTIQKYNLQLSFTSCIDPWSFRNCAIQINFTNGESINDSYAIGNNQKRECTFAPTPGYDYTNINLEDLEKIGETIDENIFYKPKDIRKYFNDIYDLDYNETYEQLKEYYKRDYDFVVIFWQDPFGDLIEIMNTDFHNHIFKQC
ncbi:MAG: hypothetical protein PHY30_01720 [Candidatus Pacebacteria bacterium]|nr:hypothetical protein [Candidatus Paceibacterota bacterium]